MRKVKTSQIANNGTCMMYVHKIEQKIKKILSYFGFTLYYVDTLLV